MPSGFKGFSEEAIAFFRGLERNNRREWFQARKQVFEERVKAPMIEMVTALAREMQSYAPDYVPVDPAKTIYRIYRDTRFSNDKTPYKTHIAATFPPRGLEKHAGGGLYFSISHKEVEVAGGVYMPGPEQLLAIRTYLAEHYDEFDRIVKNRTVRALVGDLWGDSLARMPKGFPTDHPAAECLKRKQWILYDTRLDPKIATTPALFTEVNKRLRVMMPFVEFLNRPLVAAAKKPAVSAYFG